MNSSKIHRENSSLFLNREYWIPDQKAKVCFQCNKEFVVLITRRHHCRICGNVFCAECSNKFLEEPFVFEDEKKIRVCDQCFEHSQEQIKKMASEYNSSLKPGSLTQEGLRFTIAMPVFLTHDDQEKEINGSLKAMVQLASKEILGYILKSKGLYDSWYSVLESCVLEPLCEVQTNPIDEDDAVDINKYIKIKKVPYPNKSQTRLVKGLVVRKNVPHKKMAVRFDNPTILMIGSSIEIYDNGDITSMNQVIDNEKRQMTEIVSVIRKCAPNILLVEKTVNRIVQQQLLKHNIPVLFKFKPSQFAKIAWATGARITTDLRKAEQDRDSVLGRCQTFSIMNHENIECYQKANEQGEAKFNLTNFDPSLLYISNRQDISQGATITISGPDYKELKTIKECLKKFFRSCRHLVLEKEIILQDIFLYHSERKLSKMIMEARGDFQRNSIATETMVLPCVDYTDVFSKVEICAERGPNHSLFCKKTTESAGYFTRFLSISPKAEEMMSEKEINFTFVERTMMNVEDQFDSLNKAEIDSLMKEAKTQPRGHLEFLSQLCTTPVFQAVKLFVPKREKEGTKKDKESERETCLGHYIRERIDSLDSKCEKCGRPGHLHTSFYYREGSFIKISSEMTKDGVLKNRRKTKFEKHEKLENGQPNRSESVFAHMQHEEEPGSGNYFSTFVNFFSKRGEDDDYKRSPMKQTGSSSARQMSRLSMYLECDICKKRISEEPAIKNGYLEYSMVRFLEQFIRSGEHAPYLQDDDNSHVRNTRPSHNQRDCCQSSSKSRVFKFQDVLIKFSKGTTPVYKLDQMIYTSTRMIELRKESEDSAIKDKADWAKMVLEKYYELVSSSVLRLVEVLLDKTQLNITDDDTLTDIIHLLDKKTMLSNNLQNQLLRDSLRVLKNLENIKDQMDVKFNQGFSNHIEVDILRESLYRQIKATCEAADFARTEYLNPPKQQMTESKLLKSTSQVNDVVELNAVPKLSPMQSMKEKTSDEQNLGEVPFFRMLSDSMIRKSGVTSPTRVSESPEEGAKKRISQHIPAEGNPNSSNASAGSGGGEKDHVGNPELVMESSMVSRTSTAMMGKLSKKPLATLRITNRAYSYAENPDAEEIELMKNIYAGFITYDQDPDEIKHQKFVLNSRSIDFKEIEKLAHTDQLLPTFEVALKAKLMRSDENPLLIKSSPQENQMKGICSIVESLIRDLTPQNPSKKGANVPNFDLINDITGLIDLGLPAQMKNIVIERLVCPGFKVNVYYPTQFQTYRLINGITHSDFIKSIAKSFDYSEISGGKSNASFIKSHDGIYILKDMKKFEFKMLTSMIFDYFKYMWEVRKGEHPSLLAKIYGMFEVSIKDGEKYHYILMENLFHDTTASRIYDLKGSETNRYIPNPKGTKSGKTLLDTNFKIDQNGEPICLERSKYLEVAQALKNDAEFLASMNRIDYSLLLILDDEKQVCKMGIIDYLREYTWDKEVESKAKTIMTGAKPTIIKTSSYKNRFVSALEKVFMEVEVKAGEKEPENIYKIEEKSVKVISL